MRSWLGSLKGAAWLFIATWTVHTLDHARRGVDASPEGVFWAGTAVALLAAVVITLILTDHPTAPALALMSFPAIAVGVTASHLPPKWGPLSDPILVDSATDGWSVPAVGGEIVAALWLGYVAFRIMRRNDYAWSISAPGWGAASAAG